MKSFVGEGGERLKFRSEVWRMDEGIKEGGRRVEADER